MIKISIQRPDQIGGQITKISYDKDSIIIDLGHNLPTSNKNEDPLNNSKEIAKITKGCKAILYTHYHGDHIGLCHHVDKKVPQYIGYAAKLVMCYKNEHMAKAEKTNFGKEAKKILTTALKMHAFEAKSPMKFGDNIKVTPYFVSHSACDAYMFLIEIEKEGITILHTGDFRGHGLLSKGLMPTLKSFKKPVDVLITEGTMLSRPSENIKSEQELGNDIKKLMKKYKNVFIHCSSTDMERLAVIKGAHDEAHPGSPYNCPFVCDNYQKKILDVFSSTKGIYTPAFQFGMLFEYFFKKEKNGLRDKMIEKGFTMLVRPTKQFHSCLDEILPKLDSKQTLFIYSMWHGYIDGKDTKNDDYIKLRNRFKDCTICNIHTSGHATCETLREVSQYLKPRKAIIPIHREKGTSLQDIGLSKDLQEKIITKNYQRDNLTIVFNERI